MTYSVRAADGNLIEVYDELCLKEPWLELILIRIKTLETRTKCLFKEAREMVLASSLQIDQWAWDHPHVGGLLDAAAKARALAGLGKLRGLGGMSGFRPGVPGVDDNAARISIALPDGKVRQMSEISNVQRLVPEPTVRVRPDGTLIAGASQGIFKVPKTLVRIANV